MCCQTGWQGHPGGRTRGLLIYCRADLKAAQYVGEGFEAVLECAGIQLPWGAENLKIVLIYRPSRSPFSENDDNNTAKLCLALNALSGRVLVFGDFNLPGIDWERLYSSNAGEKVVLDLFQNKFWSQHVEFNTHIDGNLLDLVLSSDAEMVHSVSDLGMLGSGDQDL